LRRFARGLNFNLPSYFCNAIGVARTHRESLVGQKMVRQPCSTIAPMVSSALPSSRLLM
jgi:hypothetical protein